MMKGESLKEFIFIIFSGLILVVVIGVFLYIVKFGYMDERMENHLNSIQNDLRAESRVRDNLDTSVLEDKRFKRLKENSVPEETLNIGRKNPFSKF